MSVLLCAMLNGRDHIADPAAPAAFGGMAKRVAAAAAKTKLRLD
jgi:hypothetical protein